MGDKHRSEGLGLACANCIARELFYLCTIVKCTTCTEIENFSKFMNFWLKLEWALKNSFSNQQCLGVIYEKKITMYVVS
jgi:hypothetical protein